MSKPNKYNRDNVNDKQERERRIRQQAKIDEKRCVQQTLVTDEPTRNKETNEQ